MISNIKKKIKTGIITTALGLSCAVAFTPLIDCNTAFADTDYGIVSDDDFDPSYRNYNVGFITADSLPAQTYTGKEITPSPVIMNGDYRLVEGKDYSLSYADNIDAGSDAIIYIKGIGEYYGNSKIHFDIVPKNIKNSSYTISNISNVTYTGNNITPSPVVCVDGVNMYDTNDFFCTYSNNKKVGLATVKMHFVDNYKGTIEKSFYILPKSPVISKRTYKSSTSTMVSWNKVSGVSGYIIRMYDTASKTYKDVATIKSAKKTSYTLKHLKKSGHVKLKIYSYYDVPNGKRIIGTGNSYSFIPGKTLTSIKSKFTSKSFTLAQGQSRTLTFTTKPYTVSVNKLKLTSSNPDVATVSPNGKVTAVNPGKATIKITSTDGSDTQLSIKVNVTKRASSFSPNDSKLTIVNTSHSKYTYNEMVNDLKLFKSSYSEFLNIKSLGKTADSRNIYEVTLGNPNAPNQILICGSTHAREYMTTQLIMKQIELYCRYYFTGIYDDNYYSEIFDKTCIHFVPMLNPDGVTISQSGPSAIRDKKLRANLYTMKKQCGGGSSFFTRWKANARGVDLNRNYDADDTVHFKNGLPRDNGYCGPYAISEKETKILSKRFLSLKPDAMISYHATGSIIYWNYGQTGKHLKNSKKLFNTAYTLTGYTPVPGVSNGGGFSNWTSERHYTPSLTIEIGTSACPLPSWEFKGIWKRNRYVPVAEALTVATKFK